MGDIKAFIGASFTVLVLAAFFFVVLSTLGCSRAFDKVKVNLNDQREIYELEPVYAHDCEELVTAFDGYEELVTRTVADDDPNWSIIAASECRTLYAHLDAFVEVCPGVHPGLTQDTIMRCARVGAMR